MPSCNLVPGCSCSSCWWKHHQGLCYHIVFFIPLLAVITPTRAILSEAQNHAILKSCPWLLILILLVKTPTRAILKNLAILPTCNPVPAVSLKRSAKSCHLAILFLAVNTHLVGENTNKGYSEKSCQLAILSRLFPQSSIPSRKPAPSL